MPFKKYSWIEQDWLLVDDRDDDDHNNNVDDGDGRYYRLCPLDATDRGWLAGWGAQARKRNKQGKKLWTLYHRIVHLHFIIHKFNQIKRII